MSKSYVLAIPMTSFDASTLGVTYQAVNPSGFPNSLRHLRIINASNVGIDISFDGVTDHDFSQIENWTDTALFGDASSDYTGGFSRGEKVYVKGTPGIGFLYVVGYYQPQ